jgi:hypothetical protein
MANVLPIDDSLLPKRLSPRLVVDQPLEPGNELYEPLYENDPDGFDVKAGAKTASAEAGLKCVGQYRVDDSVGIDKLMAGSP